MRRLAMVTSTVLLLALTFACKSGGKSDSASHERVDEAIMAITNAAIAHAQANGNQFVETGYPTYCRSGSLLSPPSADSVFAQIGYEHEGGNESYCYNVSRDRTRLAIGAEVGGDVPFRCLVSEVEDGAITHGSIRSADTCAP